MDPVSRREVWDIIERAKKGRVVILTTHSMEEADTLADTIGTAFSPAIQRQHQLTIHTHTHTHTHALTQNGAAIMAKGQLQCMGSAIHLKKKFGAVRRSHHHSLLSVSDLKSCCRLCLCMVRRATKSLWPSGGRRAEPLPSFSSLKSKVRSAYHFRLAFLCVRDLLLLTCRAMQAS